MRIGELARRADMVPSTVRFYEREGLLPRPPRISGRRVYQGEDLDRLALIEFARACGFTLREIRRLQSADVPGPANARWARFANAKLTEVAALEARAKVMRKLLAQAIRCNCINLAECGRRLRKARSSATKRS